MNDDERRNGNGRPLFSVILPNLVALGANHVKVSEVKPTLSVTKV